MRFTLAEMDHQNRVHFKTEKSGLEAVRVYVRVRRNPECPGICAQLLRHILDPVTRFFYVSKTFIFITSIIADSKHCQTV